MEEKYKGLRVKHLEVTRQLQYAEGLLIRALGVLNRSNKDPDCRKKIIGDIERFV